MRTVAEILRQRREEAGLTLQALADQAGVTKGYLSMIENDRVPTPPSAKVVAALEKALGIRDQELSRAADWQHTPAPVRQTLQELLGQAQRGQDLARWLMDSSAGRRGGGRNLDELHRSGELRRKVQAALAGQDETPGASAQLLWGRRVPLINKVAAGYPRDFSDLGYPARVADEYVACPELHDPDAFAARVIGDSMAPEYVEGDIVVFSPKAAVADGADCFVRLEPDHETTFKRVFFQPAGRSRSAIRLQPLNPTYPPRVVRREEVAGLYRAVWRMQRLG